MTIDTVSRSTLPYVADGVTTVFPFAFHAFADADIQVSLIDALGNYTPQTFGYSVFLNLDQTNNPGGTVTFSTPPAAGLNVEIDSVVAAAQGSHITNAGGFFPQVIEAALDKLTALVQDLQALQARSIKAPRGNLANLTLPPATLRAGYALGFDSTGAVSLIPSTSLQLTASLTGKADRFPTNPFSLVMAGATKVLADAKSKWWNGTNLLPTDGSNTVISGVPTTGQMSMWQMWSLFNSIIYEPWQYAKSINDTATMASLVTMANQQWTYIKTQFTTTQLKHGFRTVINTLDDFRVHLNGLCELHEMTGASDALLIAEEALWYFQTIFVDVNYAPITTSLYHGSITPDGTLCQSSSNGLLYVSASDATVTQTYGYTASADNFGIARSAFYLYAAGVATNGACLAYAESVVNLLAAGGFMRGAPANNTKSAQYSIFCLSNRDPNVAAANVTVRAGSISGTTFTAGGTVVGTLVVGQYLRGVNITPGTKIVSGSGTTWTVNISQTAAAAAVNASLAVTGQGDPNQIANHGQNEFFGMPVRGTCAEYLDGASMAADLCAVLYSATGLTAYLTYTQNILSSIASLQSFGRQAWAGGPVSLIAARDPWSDAWNLPRVFRSAMGLPGVDTANLLKLAVVNTAKNIILSEAGGFLTPDWTPIEEGLGTAKSWIEDGAAGYGGTLGGGQAKPQEAPTHGNSLSVVNAARLVAQSVASLGSGISQPVMIEGLASDLLAVQNGLHARFSKTGGTVTGRVNIRHTGFFFDVNSNGQSLINFATNIFDTSDSVTQQRRFYVGNATVPTLTLGADGSVRPTGPVYFNTVDGTHLNQYLNVNGNGDVVLNVDVGAYLVYRPSSKKWGLASNNVLQWSMDSTSGVTTKRAADVVGTPSL